MNSTNSGAGREGLLFYAAVGLLLLPIWWFAVFPTQDGPAHLYNADLIRQLLGNANSWFSGWVSLNPRPDPTWPPHLFLAALLAIFPVDFAEKLFQSLCIASLPLAARFALHGREPGSEKWAWLAFPMAYNFPFHLGFYSFSLGLSCSILMLGYWLRHDGQWGPRTIAVQASLALAAYFSHIFAMLAFGVAMLPMALTVLWRVWRAEGLPGVLKGRLVPWAIAFAPALLLAAEFMLARTQEAYPIDFEWRFKALAQFSALQSYSDIERFPAIAVVASLFVLSSMAVVGAIRDKHATAIAWAGAMGLLFVMAMLMPESRMISENGMKGGAYLVPRIGVVFYLSSLFLIASQLGRPRFGKLLVLMAAVLTVAGFAVRWPIYVEIEHQLSEYDAAGQFVNGGDVVIALNIQQGSFLSERRNVTAYADPTLHEVDRIAAKRGAFTFNNYQGNMGYFPLLFKAEANPLLYLGSLEAEPPEVDVPGFERALGRPVDVILVWMAESLFFNAEPQIRAIEGAGFRRVYVSEPQSRMWVYRRPPKQP